MAIMVPSNKDKEPVMSEPVLIVHRDPEILGGTSVFVGTRVPVKILFQYLEAGDSLDVFLDEYPSVGRAQAVAALELLAIQPGQLVRVEA